jgi:hypothetical protein
MEQCKIATLDVSGCEYPNIATQFSKSQHQQTGMMPGRAMLARALLTHMIVGICSETTGEELSVQRRT